MTINLNTNPYFDDFNADKNYVKILFKPGYAVQARELTQMQTAIQRQISKFGGHIFKNGSIVWGGKTSTSNKQYIDVAIDQADPIELLIGKNIIQGTAKAKVNLVKRITPTSARLYFSYLSGVEFGSGSVTGAEAPIGPWDIIEVDGLISAGTAVLFSIDPTVFFINEYFTYCNSQTISISDDATSAFNVRVGVGVQDSIVTSDEDSTLLDPATSGYNFAAPGADRYSITLTLESREYDPEDLRAPQTLDENAADDFIELSRYESGNLIATVTRANYSDLETTLARRTYDESGDYTVRPFMIKVKDHIFKDPDNFSLAIEPGKAYVKGYEFETTSTVHLDLPRSLDFKSVTNAAVQADFGSYLLINDPTNAVAYHEFPYIYLVNESNVNVGTAVICTASHGGANNTIKVQLININPIAGADIKTATKIKATDNSWEAAISGTAGIISSYRKANIARLPNNNLKELLTNGTSYTTILAYENVSFDGDGIGTISPGANKQFYSVTPSDYLVINSTNGDTLPVASVSVAAGTNRQITLVGGSSVSAVVYASVQINNATPKTKTLNEDHIINVTTAGPLRIAGEPVVVSLGKSDCIRVKSIIATLSTPGSDPIDVTDRFDFDNGQRDEIYDHGSIKLKQYASDITNLASLAIKVDYFTHVGTAGFFSVGSYPIPREDVPKFKASNGEIYDLYDCMDFRAVRANNSTNIVGGFYPEIDSVINSDYSYYTSRIDKLVLTKERKLSIVKGIPAEVPTAPSDMYDAMTLYTISVPPYTKNPADVSFSFVENKRYTMRDIGKIEKRVERMEYYTSLSLLEKQAADEKFYDDAGLERFKNGILVDSFAGHNIGDCEMWDYSCSIDPENRILRPQFSPHTIQYIPSVLESTAKVRGDLITLPYTTKVLSEQPWATGAVNINPYMTFNWVGTMTLSPPGDVWVDTKTLPDVNVNLNGTNDAFLITNVNNPAAVGVRWDDWRTTVRGTETTLTTGSNNASSNISSGSSFVGSEISSADPPTIRTDLGTKVVDVSLSHFIRPQVVRYAAKNLKPDTELYAYFDGTDVSSYCIPALEITFTDPVVQFSGASKIISGSNSATVITCQGNKAYVIMDPAASGSGFSVGETVSWEGISGNSVISGIFLPSTIKTNEDGVVAGLFNLPNNENLKFRVGERVFRLSDATENMATTAAETKFVAMGMSQSVDRTIVSTRVVSSLPATSALTPNPRPPGLRTVICSQKASGKQGTFTYDLDFAGQTGDCGINYSIKSNTPIKFTINWNGTEYTTGVIGTQQTTATPESTSLWNRLLGGRAMPTISNSVTNGEGSLTFWKTDQGPDRATVTVEADVTGADWEIESFCPAPPAGANSHDPILLDVSTSNTISSTQMADNDTIRWPVMIAVNRLDRSTDTWAKVSLPTPVTTNGFSGPGARYFSSISSNTAITEVIVKVGTPRRIFLEVPNPNKMLPLGRHTSYRITLNSTAEEYTNETATIRTDAPLVSDQERVWVNITPAPPEQVDPVAQTFFVDPSRFPNGIFVESIDIFFRKKSLEVPVMLQIRPVVNGYPSSSKILPFGVSSLTPDEVKTSVDGTDKSTFVLENIVYLPPGEHSFVVLSTTDEYEAFTSTLGEYALNAEGNPDPNNRVTQQPTLGSIFKSQNASTWTPEQETDIKYRINMCSFDITQQRTAILKTKTPGDKAISVNSIKNNGSTPGNFTYDVFYTSGEMLDFGDTNIDMLYSINGETTFSAYQLGTNITLDTETEFVATNSNAVRLQAKLSSNDPHITPVIDVARLSGVLVHNIINSLPESDTSELSPHSGGAFSRYMTKKVVLNPGFESSDIKVFFNANIPAGASVRVYYKVAVRESTEQFDNNPWVRMELLKAGSYTSTGFSEYQYKTPYTDVNGNTRAFNNANKFATFAIKLVLLSDDTTKIPRIKDLRAVAFDD